VDIAEGFDLENRTQTFCPSRPAALKYLQRRSRIGGVGNRAAPDRPTHLRFLYYLVFTPRSSGEAGL
jgi:hypothetical protein